MKVGKFSKLYSLWQTATREGGQDATSVPTMKAAYGPLPGTGW